MKFLVDAQLPQKLALWLKNAGFEAIHTLDLPSANRTTDSYINELSIKEGYILITKDSDFVNSFIVKHEPHKLFLISTGNITNKSLENLIRANFAEIAHLFETHEFIELGRTNIIVHL